MTQRACANPRAVADTRPSATDLDAPRCQADIGTGVGSDLEDVDAGSPRFLQATREGPIDLVVDLSSVSSISETQASWTRLMRLINAYLDFAREFNPVPRIFGVADNNLRHKLPKADRAKLAEAEKAGWVVSEPKADPLVLDLAKKFNAHILAKDQFERERKFFPWIEDPDEHWRFLAWNRSGQIELNVIRSISTLKQTRGLEFDYHLRPLGYRTPKQVREVLARQWRCRRCTAITDENNRLILMPRRRPDGTLECPVCQQPVEDAGAAVPFRWAKIHRLDGGREVRVKIEAGQTLHVRWSVDRSVRPSVPVRGLLTESERVDANHGLLKLSIDFTLGLPGDDVRNWNPATDVLLHSDTRASLAAALVPHDYRTKRLIQPGRLQRLQTGQRVVIEDVIAFQYSGWQTPYLTDILLDDVLHGTGS